MTIKHAALDPLRGYANAIRDALPDAVAVLDAFHVVKVGSTALEGAVAGSNRRPCTVEATRTTLCVGSGGR